MDGQFYFEHFNPKIFKYELALKQDGSIVILAVDESMLYIFPAKDGQDTVKE